MTSTIWAASNFCMITRWSPPSMLLSVVNPVEWYIGATTRMTCGIGTGPHMAIIGVLNTSWYTAGRLITMTFGSPVDPLLQMPINDGDTTSARSSAARSSAVRSSRSFPSARHSSIQRSIDGMSDSSRYTAASTVSRRRARSQSGRSHRTGTGIDPSFHAATDASTRCNEFGMAMPIRSPNPAPRSRSVRASASERRSSSRHVSDVSTPSGATWRTTTASGSLAANARTRDG